MIDRWKSPHFGGAERQHGSGAVRRQELGDDGERALPRAAIGFDQRPRRRAEAGAPHRIREEIDQHGLEPGRRVHLDGAAILEERAGDLGEVVHVRAEDDRLAEHRGLEDVVAAGVGQAAADEHQRGNLVQLRELADRVEDDHVDARFGVDGQLLAPRHAPAALLREALGLDEALRLPRRDDEQRIAPGGANPLERVEMTVTVTE